MQAKCCVYSVCAVCLGWKTEKWCQLHPLSKVALMQPIRGERSPALDVGLLIEGRAQRAGPPPLFVPHKIIWFSTSMWLVGYSEVRRRLSSSLLRCFLAKTATKKTTPNWETQSSLCLRAMSIFKNNSRTSTSPKPNTHRVWLAAAVAPGCPPGSLQTPAYNYRRVLLEEKKEPAKFHMVALCRWDQALSQPNFRVVFIIFCQRVDACWHSSDL